MQERRRKKEPNKKDVRFCRLSPSELEKLPHHRFQVKPKQRLCDTVDSKKLEHGRRMFYTGFASFFGLGLDDGHVPTFWLLLYVQGTWTHCLLWPDFATSARPLSACFWQAV